MPTLCDFIEIIGNSPQTIPPTPGDTYVSLPDFNTGGRQADETALLMLSARNLTGSALVFINGAFVGIISATPATAFSTQLISVPGDRINNGNNDIILRNVSDAFELKNVVCFFHQDS